MCGWGLTPGVRKAQAEQQAARDKMRGRYVGGKQARQEVAAAVLHQAERVSKAGADRRAAMHKLSRRVYELEGTPPRPGVLLFGFAAIVLCWWAGGYLLSLQAQSSSSLIESLAHGIGIYFLGKGCFIAALLTAVGSGERKRRFGRPGDLSELELLGDQ